MDAPSSRFLDASEEPMQDLLPIEGYEKKKLLPLEKAVEPLFPHVHDLLTRVWIAKRNSANPPDGLTPDESASIHLYTMQWPRPHLSLYTLLNQTLRQAKRDSLIPWFSYLKLFLTAVYKLPTIKGIVWRGIRGNVTSRYIQDHIWWGFSSCTETLPVLEKFVGTSGERTLFEIECSNGKMIQRHSFFKNENEILLTPGCYFVVIDKWSPSKDLHIIRLCESTPPYQLIASPFESFPGHNSLGKPFEFHEMIFAIESAAEDPKPWATSLSIDIHPNAKWIQNGVTVAGGNGGGIRINQLCNPLDLYVADDQTVYVADAHNHRIVEWKWGATSGKVVAGGNGPGEEDHQLNSPFDVIVDRERDALIICDNNNQRLVQWPRRNGTRGETIISNIVCTSVTMDENGSLYITDWDNHQVRRYRRGENQGTVVAGGNGQGNHLDQLSNPACAFVDRDHSVYVSDWRNHRVMKWVEGAKQGIVVAGGQGQGNSLTQLHYPNGVVVDQLGAVYVAEQGNDRIMRWSKGATHGSVIAGGNGRGEQSKQLNWPIGLSFDRHGNLYVVDHQNHRVQKFNIDNN